MAESRRAPDPRDAGGGIQQRRYRLPILLAGLFAYRTARLRGHELRITIPIGVAVVAGGLATALSDTAAAVGDHGRDLWSFEAWEDLLLVCVPASFILSYVLRRVCIEELSGRINAYDTLPQARGKLRRALRDPTLQILVPGTSDSQWVDANGYRHPPPIADTGRLLVPVLDESEKRVAVVSLHPSLDRSSDLLTATAQSLVLVLDNARLLAQLLDELSLVEQSRSRVDAAVAAERRKIRHRTGAGPLTLADAACGHLDNAVAALTAAAQPIPDARPRRGRPLSTRQTTYALAEQRRRTTRPGERPRRGHPAGACGSPRCPRGRDGPPRRSGKQSKSPILSSPPRWATRSSTRDPTRRSA